VALVCRKWEQSADTAAKAGMRVVKGRIGMVLSSKGGTLPMMLPSFKLGVAGVVGDGRQYISWVELDDLVRMFEFLLHQSDISGPVNLVSPEPVTNREFTQNAGEPAEAAHRHENAGVLPPGQYLARWAMS
jgi:NAD dependent epimerase/dehydratase family enzyme